MGVVELSFRGTCDTSQVYDSDTLRETIVETNLFLNFLPPLYNLVGRHVQSEEISVKQNALLNSKTVMTTSGLNTVVPHTITGYSSI